jgi:hypothetical protein
VTVVSLAVLWLGMPVPLPGSESSARNLPLAVNRDVTSQYLAAPGVTGTAAAGPGRGRIMINDDPSHAAARSDSVRHGGNHSSCQNLLLVRVYY